MSQILELPDWTTFKAICITKKVLNCQFTETDDRYDVYGPDANDLTWHSTVVKDGGADQADFETNFKAKFNGVIIQFDTDGAALSRIKVASTGSNFNFRMIEIQTSTVGGMSNLDQNLADAGDAIIKCYDASNALVTDPTLNSTVVKTVMDLEPPYNIQVVGGCIKPTAMPTVDVILNVIAVPDVPAIYGGSKVFVQNVNLSYIDGAIGLNADGRAAKLLLYNPTYHTNKFRFQFTHPAGYQMWLGVMMEIYRP